MTQKIAFFNLKGGTGKTTSSINVAGELASRGKKVLIIDSDPQGNASQNIGCFSSERVSISEVLTGDADINNVIVSSDIKNIDILTSNMRLIDTEEKIKLTENNSHCLTKCMAGLKKKYDFIIVDCSPSFGLLTTNVLTYVDNVLIPIKTDRSSLEGFENLSGKVKEIRETSNENIKILGVFLTVFEKGTVIDKEMYNQSKDKFGDLFMKSIINKNVAVREAPLVNLPVVDYAKRSKGSKDYKSLTTEIIKRLGER